MRDFLEYYKSMGANITEKIDFVIDELKVNKYQTVIDFGCADGQVLRALAPLFPNITFVGYDINRTVIENNIKLNSIDNINYVYNIKQITYSSDLTMVMFSSVLHEVFTFLNTFEISKILDFVKDMKAIAIRDMFFHKQKDSPEVYKDDGSEIFKKFQEYHKTNRDEIIGAENIVEYLLKKRYLTNFNEEVKEKYFSVPWKELKYTFHSQGFRQVYLNEYMNEFLLSKISNLNKYTYFTHCKTIYKKVNTN